MQVAGDLVVGTTGPVRDVLFKGLGDLGLGLGFGTWVGFDDGPLPRTSSLNRIYENGDSRRENFRCSILPTFRNTFLCFSLLSFIHSDSSRMNVGRLEI